MSDQMLADAQAVLDREQIAFLGDTQERDRMSAWFNACLNSACGPIKSKYGDIAAAVLLQTWADTARSKAEAKESA